MTVNLSKEPLFEGQTDLSSPKPVTVRKFLIVMLFGEACDDHRGTQRPAGSGATRCDTAPC
jgi:hypothetical protein